MNDIGTVLRDQGRLDEALKYFQQALAIEDQLVDLHNQIASLDGIGRIYYDQGQLNEELDCFQQAFIIVEQVKALDLVEPLRNNLRHIRSQLT